jgi:hypothetical protein
METETAAGSAGTVARGGAMFQHHTTRELLQVNTTYLREYRANPTAANLLALKQTVWALEARGAM